LQHLTEQLTQVNYLLICIEDVKEVTADFAIRPALSFTTNQGLIAQLSTTAGSGGRALAGCTVATNSKAASHAKTDGFASPSD